MVHQTIPVLVVGAGPAGLIAALQLAKNGVPCVLAERNLNTTKWPKMDVTNCRSMEILRRLGVAQGLRDVGVPGEYSFDVKFSTGLSDGGKLVESWSLPSPDDWRARIQTQNDGSMPREPYQRCSQSIFEAWLKPRIQAEPLITSHFGWKFESLIETESQVRCNFTDETGASHIVIAQYVIACDGAGSRVRKSIGINLTGGPVPGALYLVHFKSRDLSKLQRQGQFWHIFFTTGSAIIAQDEKDTWTLHTPVPIGFDCSTLDPKETIYKGLGGSKDALKIEIDEILITSNWRPNICLADKYISEKGRVFLSGDSAHQNIPTGGYGMNTAVGDSFDIGWKVAAVVMGHGGEALLRSYEEERRPVAARNIDQSGIHWSVHTKVWDWCAQGDASADDDQGRELRAKISKHVLENDAENKALGIELGYRYNQSSVLNSEPDSVPEPEWRLFDYVPSTWPGARAPHVFLQNGTTSIFDLFGTGAQYSLIDFSADAKYLRLIQPVAQDIGMPLKVIQLPDEKHVRQIWERDAVLVRPDDHVCWRAPIIGNTDNLDIEKILLVALGRRVNQRKSQAQSQYASGLSTGKTTFASTVGNVDQTKVEMLATFQS